MVLSRKIWSSFSCKFVFTNLYQQNYILQNIHLILFVSHMVDYARHFVEYVIWQADTHPGPLPPPPMFAVKDGLDDGWHLDKHVHCDLFSQIGILHLGKSSSPQLINRRCECPVWICSFHLPTSYRGEHSTMRFRYIKWQTITAS